MLTILLEDLHKCYCVERVFLAYFKAYLRFLCPHTDESLPQPLLCKKRPISLIYGYTAL